jgi:hypothetical protein
MRPAHGWRATNEEGQEVQRPARAHIFAVMAAFLAIIAASALWIVNLRSGPRLDAFSGGAMVVFVPFLLLIVVGIWLAIRGALHGRITWRSPMVLIGSLILASLFVIGYCGPVACFMPGSNRLMGWFVLGGAALAALVHHLVLNRFTPTTDNGR